MLLACAVPAGASAGPLRDAVEKAAREAALAQQAPEGRSRTRMWTGIGLLAGGAALATLGSVEIGDDENGPDDGEDFDESDDGEDADGPNKAMLGGGIAAAALGSVLLLTGRNRGPAVNVRRTGITIRQTIRF
jgi:hypothetical protein